MEDRDESQCRRCGIRRKDTLEGHLLIHKKLGYLVCEPCSKLEYMDSKDNQKIVKLMRGDIRRAIHHSTHTPAEQRKFLKRLKNWSDEDVMAFWETEVKPKLEEEG